MIKDERIDRALKEVTGFTPEQLITERRFRDIVRPRQIGIYFYACVYGPVNAAKRFDKDHATANHCKKVIHNLYGQKCESELTDMVTLMIEKTGIRTSLRMSAISEYCI